MLRIGIAGMGVMGKNHYRVIQKVENAEIVAICDTANLTDYNLPKFDNLEAMIENVELDAVIISVPTFLHKKEAEKLIKRRIPVFIEKPIASTYEEGLELKELSEIYDTPVIVGHVERFNPVVTALIKELENKEIYSIHVTRVGPFPPRIADVGVLTDLSVHDIDLIRFITKKEISSVNVYKSRKIHNHFEDNALLSFSLESNIVAGIMTNWLTPFKKRTIEVATSVAYYEADLLNQRLIEYSSYTLNNSYVHRDCFVQKSEPLLSEDSAFFNFILKKEAGNLATLDDGLKTLEVIEYGKKAKEGAKK